MKILNIISFIVLGVAFFFILAVFYFIYSPINIIDYQKNPIFLPKTVYHAGDIISFSVHYCKHKNIVGTHTLQFISNTNTILPSNSSVLYLPVGCGTLSRKITIINAAPPGIYKLVDRVDYEYPFFVFAGRNIIYTIESIPFKIISYE